MIRPYFSMYSVRPSENERSAPRSPFPDRSANARPGRFKPESLAAIWRFGKVIMQRGGCQSSLSSGDLHLCWPPWRIPSSGSVCLSKHVGDAKRLNDNVKRFREYLAKLGGTAPSCLPMKIAVLFLLLLAPSLTMAQGSAPEPPDEGSAGATPNETATVIADTATPGQIIPDDETPEARLDRLFGALANAEG